MPVEIEDPSFEVMNRIREIQTLSASGMYDDQELAEREEAAGAYALEDEAHFVAYLEDCVRTSADARIDIRQKQAQCWDVYNEKESMCTLMCLHEDALKWIVNPPTEINVDALVDPTDVNSWPGKEYLTQDTPHGQQAIRTLARRDPTGSVLSNMQYYDQLYQRGSWVTDAVQGLPGYRQDMTWRESQQNLNQSLGVFGLMGENLEAGAVAAIEAGRDVIETYIQHHG